MKAKLALLFLIFNFCINSKEFSPKEQSDFAKASVSAKASTDKSTDKSDKKVKLKEYSPLLVVSIMVKDEEEVIEKTLEPFVNAGLDSFFVFDTGSTDKTIEVTKKFFKKHKIKNGYIAQEDFIDFSASRNRAIELTKEKFPNAGYILMPDAEWYIKNPEKLIDFCKKNINQDQNCKSYLMRLVHSEKSIDFYIDRLIRADSDCVFSGVVHEAIASAYKGRTPKDIYFTYEPGKKGVTKSLKRWERDAELLLAEHKKNPKDGRTIFYLAQTYGCIGKLKEAAKYYKLRSQMEGWPEETYMSYYRLGRTIQSMIDKNIGNYTWTDALQIYHKAHSLRPHRAEPLVSIAYHYFSQADYSLGYIYAQRATQLPYPKEDILFIEKSMYDHMRWEILANCAWFLQEYKAGEKAVLQALKAMPDSEGLKNKLNSYLRVQTDVQAIPAA